MNAARIPVRGFQIEDCGLKKQVVKICFILHISEFSHSVGVFHHIDIKGVPVLFIRLFDWSI